MDPQERIKDFQELLRTVTEARQSAIWTALPGVIVSFNATAMTASVMPAIQGTVRDILNPQGTGANVFGQVTNVNLPQLLDCPVVFPSGGGFTLTFPVQAGDECLIVFASRCIDAWWAYGAGTSSAITPQPQLEYRMHDLSDGFVIVGPKSTPHVISGISLNSTQLRSNDGTTYVDVKEGTITLTAPTQVIINTAQATINGPLQVNGAIVATGNVTAGSIDLETHVHTGVTTGSSNTGGPTG